MNSGNDPPDLAVKNDIFAMVDQNHYIDLNNQLFNTKKPRNTRFRDLDSDDASDYDMADKDRNKKSKTLIGNMQSNTKQTTFLKNTLLDKNPFAILDTDENPEDLTARESNKINMNQFQKGNHTEKRIKQRIPPIVITKAFKNPKDAISIITKMMKRNASFKILREGYSVNLESLDDHGTLKEFLSQQKIPFYTYTTLEKKPIRLVLKGVHHSYSPQDIAEDLSAKNVKNIKIQQMFSKGKVSMDMFIVNFEQGTKIMELMKTVKYVCHQAVSWHKFIKKDVGTQCRKCQRFGHAATNCGLEYRCVKCPHRHAPGDCPLEDDQPAVCVNCGGNHPASYKKCSVYTKYAERLAKFQGKSGNNKTQANRTNHVNSFSNSAKVKSNQSYSQALRSNDQSDSDYKFNFLSSEIDSLFNCSLTELLQKIKTFVPEYKNASDPALKKMLIVDFLSQFT